MRQAWTFVHLSGLLVACGSFAGHDYTLNVGSDNAGAPLPGLDGDGAAPATGDAAALPVTVSIVPAAPQLCSGQCVVLEVNASGGVPPYTYQWDQSVNSEGGRALVCPNTTTTYSVTVTDSERDAKSGGASSAYVTVSIGTNCSDASTIAGVSDAGDGSLLNCSRSGPAATFSPELMWSWSGPSGDTNSGVTPLVANLTDDNGDGKIDLQDTPDVVVVTTGGHLYVLDGATGRVHYAEAQTVSGLTTPALGDLDGDGVPEIVTLDATAHLVAFHHDGSLAFQSTTAIASALSGVAVAIANLNAVGSPEIIVQGSVFDATGNLLWQASSLYPQDPTAADLDGDGKLEVLFGGDAYRADGTPYFSYTPTEGGLLALPFAAVANLDADPLPEILLTSTGGGGAILAYDGSLKRNVQGVGYSAFIQDIGGNAEYAFSNGAAFTVFRGRDGSSLWTAPIANPSAAAGTSFDFMGTGSAQTVYADEQNMYVWDAVGNELFRTVRPGGTLIQSPVVADIDNDGAAEILITAQNTTGTPAPDGGPSAPTLRAFRDTQRHWMPARRIWNQSSYHVTNINEDGTVPVHEMPSWQGPNTFRVQASRCVLGPGH